MILPIINICLASVALIVWIWLGIKWLRTYKKMKAIIEVQHHLIELYKLLMDVTYCIPKEVFNAHKDEIVKMVEEYEAKPFKEYANEESN